MLTRLILAVSVAAVLFATAPAHAGPNDRMVVPPSMYFLPIHVGGLETHVDLQLFYSHYSGVGSQNPTALGVEGKLALFDRLELGVNVPFLSYQASTYGFSLDGTQIGNIIVPIKVRLVGSSTGWYALSVYLDTMLPTASGLSPRSVASLNGGFALSLSVLKIVHLAASAGLYQFINSSDGGTSWTMATVDLFGAVRLPVISWLVPMLGLQMGFPMHGSPDGYTPGGNLLIGLRFVPFIQYIHLDVATRIAFNDVAKGYNSFGQASLIFSGGVRF
jgi:hypothetical protein